MNITSQTAALPLATVVNPPTDSLRRENVSRELITQPTAASQSAAEKGVASDKERAKTPAQQNEQVDFTSLRKQAEQDAATIGDSTGDAQQESSEQKSSQQDEQHQQQTNQQEHDHPEHEHQEQAEQQLIKELVARDAEVKRHENAHASVGGLATGAPSYQYQTGPDGKRYAVGGEVSVDLTAVSGDPTATIAKMQRVQAAALAPVNPSIQDTKVAATAAKIILQAQSELLTAEAEQKQGLSSSEAKQSLADDETESSNEFDTFINQTLAAQASISTERSADVIARAGRIEHFYDEINQAYEKSGKSHFQITA
ncbi:putative metalloprotease CJM1_0395 family protein [Thalassotalea sp. PLHSN55]|uniref:putative metalloprotease CJM1_0395 family protein n=1 Tax=Thalassotalea sp. PLHSN55 TaxID=3435888 RepID=UPI003F83238A